MKRCPQCRRDYSDETLLYCLDDGMRLVDGAASEEPQTVKLHSPLDRAVHEPLGHEFADFRVDVGKRLLLRGDEPVSLTPKVFDTLLVLIQHRDEVLTKERLMNLLWADSFVEESNLTQNIAVLRKALGESSKERKFILTVPGRGYRFVAAVREWNPDRTGNAEPAISKSVATPRPVEASRGFDKRLLLAPIALALIVLAGFAAYRYITASETGQINSIAVMPFLNEGSDPEVEYLADGMTDSLINSLIQLPNLSVKGRNSVFRYKGQEVDEKKIGQELSVQAVLFGRITQRGDSVRLYLSLIESQTGTAIWGEQYDRKVNDLSLLQRDITRDVSQKLRIRLSNADARNLTKSYSENAEAYQLYLKGRYFFNKRSPEEFQKCREYFQKAIDADPTYARAYSGLADYYGISAVFGDRPPNEIWPKHEALVMKALELDPDLAEAHNSLAGLKRNYYRDWQGAEAELKRAIELDPNYAEARVHYGSHLMITGRMDEALEQRRLAVDLDPLSASINMRLAQTYYFARRYDEAVQQYRVTLELDPTNPMAHEWLGNAYEQKGMFDQAALEWSTALTLNKQDGLSRILNDELKRTDFSGAVHAVARKRIEMFQARLDRGDYIPAMLLARPYARVSDREKTFTWLKKAASEQNAFIVEILYDPLFDAFRDDERFPELVREVRSSGKP